MASATATAKRSLKKRLPVILRHAFGGRAAWHVPGNLPGGKRTQAWWLKRGRHLSPIMIRILAINVMALAILVGSLLYLGRYQDRIVERELQSLLLEARITASAVAEGATVITEDDRMALSALLARPMVRHLAETTETRARLFGPSENLMADSLALEAAQNHAPVKPAPAPAPAPDKTASWGKRLIGAVFDAVDLIPEREKYPLYREGAEQNGQQYDVVRRATQGDTATQVWSQPEGGLMLAAAAPVMHYKQVLGIIMLARSSAKIDEAILSVRLDILKIFFITLCITILLSLYLARAIARPVRLLAAAAEGLRQGQMQIIGLAGTARLLSSEAIPDLTARNDEIGDLSGALRELTGALAGRIGAIENFAADVAHELKNPLTSLRSAVETAERVQDPVQQRKLMLVIRDDVDRLDRLITDIAHASRLDAELSRAETEPVDIGAKLQALAEYYCHAAPEDKPMPAVGLVPLKERLVVIGVKQRLVQVLQNLVDNALSFSPCGGKVMLSASREGSMIRIMVEDSGPGIPENKLAAIFDRFYTERPKEEKFGIHSGLGLSISKQIIEAHRGTIRAENRKDTTGRITGARFIVELPAAD